MLGNAKEVLKMLEKQAETLYISFASGKKPPRVKLACGGRESRFLVDPAQDYPETPSVEALQTYHVDSGALLEKVNAVSYAACANPESRPTLCGVHFLGREVYCVDNCRMAVADNSPLEAAAPFSVPARMFKNWNTLFPAGEVTLDVASSISGRLDRALRLCSGCWRVRRCARRTCSPPPAGSGIRSIQRSMSGSFAI